MMRFETDQAAANSEAPRLGGGGGVGAGAGRASTVAAARVILALGPACSSGP